MSEKIFACLLRLYPARFRQRYQAEALQLLQDRLRDERGGLRRLRLWIDLLADLAAGLPRAYRNTYTTAAKTRAWQTATGIPACRTLEEEPLRPGSVVMGGIFAVAALALFIFVMNHPAAYHPFSGSIARLGAPPAGSKTNPDVQAVAEKNDAHNRSAGWFRVFRPDSLWFVCGRRVALSTPGPTCVREGRAASTASPTNSL
jgi:hypothetical protein